MKLRYFIILYISLNLSNLFSQSDSVQNFQYEFTIHIADSLASTNEYETAREMYNKALRLKKSSRFAIEQIRKIDVAINTRNCSSNIHVADSLVGINRKSDAFDIYKTCFIGNPDIGDLTNKLDKFFKVCTKQEKDFFITKLIEYTDSCIYKRLYGNGKEIIYYINKLAHGNKSYLAEFKIYERKVDSLKFMDTYPSIEYDNKNNPITKRDYYSFKSFRFKEYYATGQLAKEGEVRNGKNYGLQKQYYPDGKKNFEYYYKKDGTYDTLLKWDTNGNIKEKQIIKIKNGVGSHSFYNENNILIEKQIFNKKAKKVITYSSLGKKQREENYFNDYLSGNVVEYFQNGDTLSYKKYVNGLLNGTSKEFYPDRKIKAISKYKNGIPIGKSNTYYPNGKINCHLEYSNSGDIISENCYDVNGKLLNKVY